MRTSLWVVALLFLAFVTPKAYADDITDYTITFTGGPLLPTSGSFQYDSTVPSFSNFDVAWDGTTFDLTTAANLMATYGVGAQPSCLDSAKGAQAAFLFLTSCPSSPGSSTFFLWSGTTPAPAYGVFQFLYDSAYYGEEQFEAVSPETPGIMRAVATGSYSVSPTVVTPEPGTPALILLGIGFVLVMRKRIAQGFTKAP
jgi:hypothetical protein